MTDNSKREDDKRASVSSSSHSRSVVMKISTLVQVIVVIVLIGIGFYGGVLYERSKQDSTSSTSETIGHRFALGLIVYIDSNSITISNQDDTYNQTFTIKPTTQISINGQRSNASQLQSGDIVLIRLDKTDPAKANFILANSHFKAN